MTTPQPKSEGKPETKAARADGEDSRVAQYLAGHPDFFDRHAALLAQLRLPHVRGDGTTVSLVERQVDVLREKNRELELRLRTLVDNGRANDVLAEKIHRLTKRLIHARDLAHRVGSIEASLREDFDAREFVLLLTKQDPQLKGLEARHLRLVAADDAGVRSFESLFASGKPRCGRVRDSQREFLFPSQDVAVGSVALVPLGAGGSLGLLAIASPDADHFNPTMSTDFLARIGDLVATALE
ncbi:MAG: DUF484 family protein [Steroidobacteraceae bacterium]|jgi:uncharacterized protein YigA (DUF484 family)|nr:DUF484 family protein [Steroidobacteraceae bacterium]